MNEQFGVTWGDPLLYDLVLNTDRVSVESCVEQIRALAARPEFAETAAVACAAAGMALEARVRVGAEGPTQRRATSTSRSRRDDGRVTLRGIVIDAGERDAAEQVAAACRAWPSVDNQLRVMAKLAALFASSKT